MQRSSERATFNNGDISLFSAYVTSSYYSPGMVYNHSALGMFFCYLGMDLTLYLPDTSDYCLRFVAFINITQAGEYYFASQSFPFTNNVPQPNDIFLFVVCFNYLL